MDKSHTPSVKASLKTRFKKIKFQKIPDAIRPKEDKILSEQIQRMVPRQVQKRFLTSFKVTNSDKIPDKFTFGKKSRQTPSDFLKISLFKLPRLLFNCPS